ncbi:MAG: Thiol-disulfide isomerase, partial [Labilithrix sp.]|nr:Thiol-disulfide isomerase [Labilithrix sp.]
MKSRRIAAALLFTFLPATISLPAWSQDDPLTIQARARFKEGVDAFDKGKYEEARLAFLQAYTLKKHPAVLLNLAQSSAKSNHPLEASKYFQQFLKEATTASPQQRKDAEAGLAEVRQKLGRIDVIAPSGTDISLDDQGKVGTTPMDPIDVEPGSHTVKSPTQSATVIAVVGQKVEARLGPSAGATALGPITTPPASAGTAEQQVLPPPPPAADTTTGKHASLLSPPENMTPVYVGLAVGGVGLVSAIVFALFKSDAQSKADTVADQIRVAANARKIPTQGACNNPAGTDFAEACQTLKENNDKVDTNAAVANVSLAVMGAGVVFAGVWYLAAPKRDDAKPQTGRAPERPLVT